MKLQLYQVNKSFQAFQYSPGVFLTVKSKNYVPKSNNCNHQTRRVMYKLFTLVLACKPVNAN